MFQSYEETARPEQGPPRLAALRAKLAEIGLDGFLVPRADRFMGEYVAPRDERLGWLTGFTGSAGSCAVLAHAAAVFVDGRYTVQVRAQVDTAHFTPVNWPATRPGQWLAETAPQGARIGLDPWLHGQADLDRLSADAASRGITFVELDENPLDAIWTDQPCAPIAPLIVHPLALSGEAAHAKIARLAQTLPAGGAALITLPDSIAWLLNVRGADVPRNPVPHAMAILHADASVDLFVAPAKLTDALRAHLGAQVRCHPEEALTGMISALPGPVVMDRSACPLALLRAVSPQAERIWGDDPCILPKARKTEPEIAGMIAAHDRDAVAMVKFLAWIDAEAPGGGLSEIDVAQRLEAFRAESPELRDISFDSIVGSGPNGAIVHYRVTENTNRQLGANETLLVDSGGQYADGTTDITRTIALGSPPAPVSDSFTRVLQGLIAVSQARWPKGLAGRDLDPLARMPLWRAGRDYDHGTGHGVGAALSVHEGPQRISRISDVVLEAGMILSNEPGHYREGAFGIRLENLIVVRPAPALEDADPREMLCFETLTWVPFDRRLILLDLLSEAEIGWIDSYHGEVARRVGPHVSGPVADWLARATAPLRA